MNHKGRAWRVDVDALKALTRRKIPMSGTSRLSALYGYRNRLGEGLLDVNSVLLDPAGIDVSYHDLDTHFLTLADTGDSLVLSRIDGSSWLSEHVAQWSFETSQNIGSSPI